MFLEVSSTTQKITPNQAKLWVEKCKYDRQRPIRKQWVNYLADEMGLGRFTLNMICFAHLKEATFLANGQLSYYIITKAGK